MKRKDKDLQEHKDNGGSLNTSSIKVTQGSNDLGIVELFENQLAMLEEGADLNRPLPLLSPEAVNLNRNFKPYSGAAELSDHYGLSESSPLVYAIYLQAFKQQGKQKREIDKNAIITDLKKHAVRFKDKKPFDSKRGRLATNLAGPQYRYKMKRDSVQLEITRFVPDEPFFKQGFVNEKLASVLYAACCWAGSATPNVADDKDALVRLLVGLGFWDADADDQVYGLLIFITGEKYTRGGVGQSRYTHTRGERTYTKEKPAKSRLSLSQN